jgi:ureidoglycolate hydrolase
VTTPTDLTINVDTAASTRTITSGSIKVHHALANYDVVTTFNNAVWDINTCQPKSGSATVAVSRSKSGSGSISFNNGTVSFTYGSASGTLTLPGC